ncbi:hypothetical protein [Quadrisphaera sp. INWT6]|uniref:hypothetical protein n=1 Tax=Quadrisphaera sp. INWT6 TaxID=2596917 RepID=UPI001892379E|nr:hypothetical protein [Quadrisphaera sp. INWT6]MBF5080593.1 hypothetical protein [Quadrisphaera sp. INWT6]
MSTASAPVGALVRSLLQVDRRVGAYLFGLVFGFRAERTHGNHPGYRNEVVGRSSARAQGLEGEAHLRAVATSSTAGGAV